MVKRNQHIGTVTNDYFSGSDKYQFIDCIIATIDLIGADFKGHLIIENCVIENFQIHSCWFSSGFTLKNSIFKTSIDYQMGGHNSSPILIEGNIFLGFFNFFDCQFENSIELSNNIFIKGTNLLGNKGEGFENTFLNGWVVKNNMGEVALNIVEL
jgi:hypothetical protein